MKYAAVIALLAVAACSTPVKMQHPSTGRVVQCGPYPNGAGQAMAGAVREAQCINDFKGQGYVRVAQ